MIRRIMGALLLGLIAAAAISALGVGWMVNERMQRDFNELGKQNSLLGAQTTQFVIEKAVDNGILSIAGVFDDAYQRLPGDGAEKYRSGYDLYLERNLGPILQGFLEADSIFYAYMITRDGYIPLHTTKRLSKTRRKVALADTSRPVAKPQGVLTTGDRGFEYLEFSSPILIKNRPWGQFCVGIPTALINNEAQREIAWSAVFSSVTMLLLAMLIYFIIRRSLRPLARLSEITTQMGGGELAVRSDYLVDDEIGRLSQSFNSMAHKIQASYEELEERAEKDRQRSLELEKTLAVVKEQRDAITQLSAPIMQIWDDVLVLPIIGIMDAERSNDITQKLLDTVVEREAHCVLIDITGVEVVDTQTATHFVKMVEACRLIGAQCIVTGIHPNVARTMVEMGMDLHQVSTKRILQQGLTEAFETLGYRVDDAQTNKRKPLVINMAPAPNEATAT